MSRSARAAQAAVCTERFHISEAQTTAILIPAGTRVTDASGTLTWETVADAYVSIGETYADVQIRCQTVGAVGNGYAAGQINTFVDLFDYCERCENLTASDDGADKATDDEFYELMRASQDAYSCAGAKGGYIYFAKQVSTKIADVVANSPSDGTVDLYVLMDDGTIATTEIKNAVLAACNDDTVRPLTDKVSVKDPQKVNYNITFTYYVPKDSSLSSTEIKAAVDKAVAEFVAWQCGKLGRDINPSVLIGKLMQTGIKRVALTSRSLPRCGMDPTTRRRRLRRSGPSRPRMGATRMNKAHGITKENLLASLPAVLANDDNMAALASAVAEVLAARVGEIERVSIYSQIDRLPNEPAGHSGERLQG